MTEVLHDLFLPYSTEELRTHFVDSDVEGEDPERHLRKWQKRIADAPLKDPSFLHRDETLWTASALLAVHRHQDARERWRRLMSLLFGAIPPTPERLEWDALLGDDLQLFFEVGLPSPTTYRRWLSDHLVERHALPTQRATAASRGTALEGRTQLDAMLMCPTTGFALHVEAKVLSDIDTKTTHDPLRNQLARNIDCMAASAGSHHVLGKRRPERSFLVLLTPDVFRRNWRSRLYGHLIREYSADAAALQRDLPHLAGTDCSQLARRLGWLTFEDLRRVEPAVCQWLSGASAVAGERVGDAED